MKSISQISNSPLSSLRCLGAVHTGFSELVVLWISKTREVGIVCGLVNVSLTTLIH